MLVRLSTVEMMAASTLGTARHMQSLNRTPAADQPKENSRDAHLLGAYGEIAVAKVLGLYPGFTVNNFDRPDIEPDIEVRSTPKGRLIVHEWDKSDRKFFLVVGYAPDLDVVGWLWGHEAKNPKWLFDGNNGRRPAYFVPVEALRPVETVHANKRQQASGVGANAGVFDLQPMVPSAPFDVRGTVRDGQQERGWVGSSVVL